MAPSIDNLVADVRNLISLPDISLRVTEMVEDPDASISDIGSVISQDPALTAKILKLANSAMYGFRSEIDTVQRAITMLGTRQIRDLVLATSAVDTFKGIPNSLVSMEDFWYHSILCGIAANLLTQRSGLRNADGLFVAGLLHDIGQLVLFNKLPDESHQAILLSMEGPDEIEIYLAEQQIIGFDHTQVGAKLAKSMQLPKYLQTCIAYHHEPERSSTFEQEVSIVHLANTLAVLTELNTTELELGPPIHDSAWQLTGLDQSIIEELISEIQTQFMDIESFLLSED